MSRAPLSSAMIWVERDKRTAAPVTGGEANDGSNVGTAGVGPYKQKSGTTLQFYKANGTEGIDVSLDGTDKIDHSLDIPGLNSLSPTDVTADVLAYYSSGAAVHKKMSLQVFWAKVFNYYCTAEGDLVYEGAGDVVPTRLAIGTGGQFLRVNNGASAPAWDTVQDAKMFQIQDPTASDDGLICALFPQAATIKAVIHQVSGGTSVDWNMQVCTAPFGGATSDVFSSDEQSTTSEQTETSFNTSAIAAHDVLKINITSVSGSVDWLFVGVEYEVDA